MGPTFILLYGQDQDLFKFICLKPVCFLIRNLLFLKSHHLTFKYIQKNPSEGCGKSIFGKKTNNLGQQFYDTLMPGP